MTHSDAAAGAQNWEEPHLARIFEVVQSPLAVLSTDLVYVAVNEAYSQVSGRSQDEILGQHIFDVFPENPATRDDDDATSLRRSLRSVLEHGVADSMPLMRYDLMNGESFEQRFWSVTNTPILDDAGQVRWVLNHPEEVTRFIDERLRLEAHGDASTGTSPSQLSAVDEIFTAAVARLQSLSDLASALVGASSPDQVGDAVLRDGLQMVGACAGAFVIVNGDRLDVVGSVGVNDDIADEWKSFMIEPGADPFSDVVASGKVLYFNDRAAFLDRYPGHVDAISGSDHEAWAVLPLRGDATVTGAIGVIFDEPSEFAIPLRLVLSTLANLTSQAASRAQLLAEQTLALTSIEEAFEPRIDVIPGVRTSHLYRASTVAADAGGDWYDLIDLRNGTMLVAIGDVANHGAVAVGEMVRARSTVHALAHLGLAAEEIANEASAVLSRLASTFTTCVVGVLDLDGMELRWTNAGHPHPLVVTAAGTVEALEQTNGPPLGSGFDHTYGFERRRLQPGDTLVLYTDGLIERPGADLDEGITTLRRSLAALDGTDPEFARRLFEELHPPARQRDDVAILALHVDDPGAGGRGT